MSKVFVISRGNCPAKQFFEGDGDWASERIDAFEYPTSELALSAITNWNLDAVGEISEETALPSVSLKYR